MRVRDCRVVQWYAATSRGDDIYAVVERGGERTVIAVSVHDEEWDKHVDMSDPSVIQFGDAFYHTCAMSDFAFEPDNLGVLPIEMGKIVPELLVITGMMIERYVVLRDW